MGGFDMLGIKKYSKKSLAVLLSKISAYLKSFFSEYEGFEGLFDEEEYWSARERYNQDVYDGVDFERFKKPIDDIDDVGISYDSRIVHCLEMPLEELPLYLNSYDGLVKITVSWRLKQEHGR
jgi:hypothetical protein